MSVAVDTPPSPPWHDAPALRATDSLDLSPQQAEAMVRLVETAPAVLRRHQFFVWSQGHLDALLPHQLLVCGAYQRQRRAVEYEVFQSVVLSPSVMAWLADGNSALMRSASAAWVLGRGQPLLLEIAHFHGDAQAQALQLQRESGMAQLLLHGMARPQRPGEIESLFMLAGDGRGRLSDKQRLLHAELLMPYLHSTWRRVQTSEAELSLGPIEPVVVTRLPRAAGSLPGRDLTDRERQILLSAREGKSNQQIGDALGISPLTVKNHIQKILRKLGASNRAHAVALAMAQEQLAGER